MDIKFLLGKDLYYSKGFVRTMQEEEEYLEKLYPQYMRHTFACFTNIDEASKKKLAFEKNMPNSSFIAKKRKNIDALALNKPEQSLVRLKYILHHITEQKNLLRKTKLTLSVRSYDDVHPKSLLPHFSLLNKHFGSMFTELQGAIVLGDEVERKDVDKAMSGIVDAAHFEHLNRLLQQQKSICDQTLDHITHGGSHRIPQAKQLLQVSLEEEMFRINLLTHQKGVYNSMLG